MTEATRRVNGVLKLFARDFGCDREDWAKVCGYVTGSRCFKAKDNAASCLSITEAAHMVVLCSEAQRHEDWLEGMGCLWRSARRCDRNLGKQVELHAAIDTWGQRVSVIATTRLGTC